MKAPTLWGGKNGRGVYGGLVRNALGLYVLQIGSYLLPIVTLFLVARRLGPHDWGSLAFMQAFASFVIFAVTYGFSYYGTREVARNRDDPGALSELFAGVLGAKVVLAVVSLLIVLPVSAFVTPVHRIEGLLWPGMLWAFSWSFSSSWFYQGLERMGIAAGCETAARLLSLPAIVLLVQAPQDAWKVLAIQGGLLFAAVIVEMAIAYRMVDMRLPSARLIWHTLRGGWTTFLLQGALSFYTIGNGFILGLLGTPTVVGYYVGAERISRNFTSLLTPVTQAVFPRTSLLASRARSDAAQLARTSLVLMGAAGATMTVILFFFAPELVRLVLGPKYEQAIPVLKILALLPLLVGVNSVLAVQWMLAVGLDRLVNLVVFTAGVLNVTLALVLVPRHMHVGMAIAVVTAEAFVMVGLYTVLRIKHLDPLVLARERPSAMPTTVPA